MSKIKFDLPSIILSTSGDDSGIGGGTAQGGLKGVMPKPMSFKDWGNSKFFVAYDLDENNQASMAEYGLWWHECGFSMEDWKACGNCDEDWRTYVASR